MEIPHYANLLIVLVATLCVLAAAIGYASARQPR